MQSSPHQPNRHHDPAPVLLFPTLPNELKIHIICLLTHHRDLVSLSSLTRASHLLFGYAELFWERLVIQELIGYEETLQEFRKEFLSLKQKLKEPFWKQKYLEVYSGFRWIPEGYHVNSTGIPETVLQEHYNRIVEPRIEISLCGKEGKNY